MVVTHGSLQRARGRCALTIGNFDGVHRGHRALIDRVIAKAREAKLTPCVLTFEPHPREFFAADAAPARLTRLRDKLELMAQAGVEHVHVARFDARFAALSAERFVEEVLVRGLGVQLAAGGARFPLRRPARRRLCDAAKPRLRARGDARRPVRRQARVELRGARRARGGRPGRRRAPARPSVHHQRPRGARREARPRARLPDGQHRAAAAAADRRDLRGGSRCAMDTVWRASAGARR